jgi:hypothetical protein
VVVDRLCTPVGLQCIGMHFCACACCPIHGAQCEPCALAPAGACACWRACWHVCAYWSLQGTQNVLSATLCVFLSGTWWCACVRLSALARRAHVPAGMLCCHVELRRPGSPRLCDTCLPFDALCATSAHASWRTCPPSRTVCACLLALCTITLTCGIPVRWGIGLRSVPIRGLAAIRVELLAIA